MEYKLIHPINSDYTPTQQILTNRGIPLQEIDHYLHPVPADNLDPKLLRNLEPAAACLIQHIQRLVEDPNSTIYVVVDCDCDGYTSAACLMNYIHLRFPSIVDRFVFPMHSGKQHGLADISLQPSRGDLIIVPDASSNDYEIHRKCQELGVDVLVLDHHLAEYESPYAIVVNNQLCDYPTKSLSGVGIVYKFCQYLDTIFGDNKADQLLDLVAIGLTGDMMDQRDAETHYLTQIGLKQLRNPFIAGMADKNSYSIGDTISPYKVAFYIVPLINSITRVGTLEEKQLLFDSMLDWKAYNVIPSTKRGAGAGAKETVLAQALRVATNVKNRQTSSQDASLATVQKIIEERDLLEHKVLIIQLESASFDKGITGLIANKLMAIYQRPVGLLIKTYVDGKLAWSGSARGYSKGEFHNFRQLCRNSGLVFLAEGHEEAFGLGIYNENIDAFIEYCDEQLKDTKFEPCYKVDYIYNPSTLKAADILEIGKMIPLWGQEVDEPLVAIEHVKITASNIALMKSTLKITLPDGIECIKFRSSEEEYDKLFTENGSVTVNIVGTCGINSYFGRMTPQILIEDYEIIDQQEWYF